MIPLYAAHKVRRAARARRAHTFSTHSDFAAVDKDIFRSYGIPVLATAEAYAAQLPAALPRRQKGLGAQSPGPGRRPGKAGGSSWSDYREGAKKMVGMKIATHQTLTCASARGPYRRYPGRSTSPSSGPQGPVVIARAGGMEIENSLHRPAILREPVDPCGLRISGAQALLRLGPRRPRGGAAGYRPFRKTAKALAGLPGHGRLPRRVNPLVVTNGEGSSARWKDRDR